MHCRRKNGKRHSSKAYTWKCRHCGGLNFGPGAAQTLEKIKQLEEEQRRALEVNPQGRPATLKTKAKVAAKTTVKVTGQSTSPKPAQKAAAPAPLTPTPKQQKRGGWWELVYG